MSFDYNTSRKKIALPEYGRHIQRLVDHIMSIADREERNRATRALIDIMGNLNPHLRDVVDFKHKLWDHLAVISDFKLDIDSPYPIPTKEILSEKPRRVPYNQDRIRYKHYGKVIERMVNKASDMPEGEEKKVLTEALANIMKKQYLTWNREAVNDVNILKDLMELSKGKMVVEANDVRLSDTREILSKNIKKNGKKIIIKKDKLKSSMPHNQINKTIS
jgi:hypothetical protein